MDMTTLGPIQLPSDAEDTVWIDAAGKRATRIDATCSGKVVVVNHIDQQNWQLLLSTPPAVPSLVVLNVEGKSSLSLPSIDAAIEIRTTADDQVVLTGTQPPELRLIGGDIDVTFGSAPDALIVENARVRLPRGTKRIEIRGDVALQNVAFVKDLHLGADSSLSMLPLPNGRVSTVTVQSLSSEGAVHLKTGALKVIELRPGTLFQVERGAGLILESPETISELPPGISMSGDGSLELRKLTGTIQIDHAASVPLKLVDTHVTFLGRGQVRSLEVNASSTLLAEGLGVQSIKHVDGSELHGVSLYELKPSHVHRLDKVNSLSIWWPNGWRRRLHLEERQRGDPPAGAVAWLRDIVRPFVKDPLQAIEEKERLHHKWRRIAEILDRKGAPGSDQAQAHYSAYRWRLRSLRGRPGRQLELALLGAYWLMGYGVRPQNPLIAWAIAIAGLAVIDFDCGAPIELSALEPPTTDQVLSHATNTWASRAVLLMTSVLRTLRVPTAECMAPVVAVAQVVGVICLTFILLAVRRITRHGR